MPVAPIPTVAPASERTPGGPSSALDGLLARAVALGGSDLHLTCGVAPAVRVDGEIASLEGMPRLDPPAVARMLSGILDEPLRTRFVEDLELDTTHTVAGVGRFRVNVFMQRGCPGAVFRVIPLEVPPLESLGLPPVVDSFAEFRRGLVLVTGPTGSGKSTTLASILDRINATRRAHIVTVEDPIEFVHQPKRCLVNQREVGEDTRSFAAALRHALRQDPDVILVGEMRDLETMSTALTAAETGHLVLATLHTQGAAQSVDRVIDVFPAHQQSQVRTQLATSLQAVLTQQLVAGANGGRTAATEVLLATPAVRNLVREAKLHQLASVMQSGAASGMHTMDQSLAGLVRAGRITATAALTHAAAAEDLRRLLAA